MLLLLLLYVLSWWWWWCGGGGCCRHHLTYVSIILSYFLLTSMSLSFPPHYFSLADVVDLYSTEEPQKAFHKRIAFCLDVHNEAVKSMRYPPDAVTPPLPPPPPLVIFHLFTQFLIYPDRDKFMLFPCCDAMITPLLNTTQSPSPPQQSFSHSHHSTRRNCWRVTRRTRTPRTRNRSKS